MNTEPTIKRTNDMADLPDHWKVRIHVRGTGIIHVLSRTEPVAVNLRDDKLLDVEMDVITDTEHGDTIGYIDWSEVGAVSWRFCEHKEP